MPEATPAATQQPVTPTPDPKPVDAKPAGALPPAAEAKPEPRPDPMSPRFAALAKQTREIAAAKQELARERAAQEAAIKAREAEVQTRAQKAEEIEKQRAMALTDPATYLRGIYGDEWYDHVTKIKLEGDKGVPPDLQVRAVREELAKTTAQLRQEQEERWKKVEGEREATKKAEEDRLRTDQQQTIQEFQGECVDFVKANAEKYELTNATESQGLVWQVIEATFQKTKRVLSPAEAADLVEAHLEEQAAKVYSGKKWQARMAAEAAKKTEQPNADEPARTLTNTAATGSAIPGAGAKQDRHRAAVEAMEAAERAAAARAAK